MKRRDFIRKTILSTGAIPFTHMLNAANLPHVNVKRLVLIHCAGGNDGLNTIIPFRNDLYYKNRPTLGIEKSKTLKMTNELGLHPAMQGIAELYDQGQVCILNGVGYPNPNRSHFRSSDIWLTASASDQNWQTGWLGRWLDQKQGPMSDVIEMQAELSILLQGTKYSGMAYDVNMHYANFYQNPFFKRLIAQLNPTPNAPELNYVKHTLNESAQNTLRIEAALKSKPRNYNFPRNNLGQQLRAVSDLLHTQVSTRAYFVTQRGYDTHAGQASKHHNQLKQLSDSVSAFMKSLDNDVAKETLVVAFSEFGRRVKQNASQGTDHGTAGPVFLFSKNLHKGGFYNEASDLSNLDSNGDLQHTIDFRNLYASILDDWLETDHAPILKHHFTPLQHLL